MKNINIKELAKNIRNYLKNGKEPDDEIRLFAVFKILMGNFRIPEIDYSTFELEDIENAIEELLSTPLIDIDDDYENNDSKFVDFINNLNLAYFLAQAPPIPTNENKGEDHDDFI